jgi:Rrf2 family cysteine metabolism transcriptional repressor
MNVNDFSLKKYLTSLIGLVRIITKLVNHITLECTMLLLSSKVKYGIAALMELVNYYEIDLLQTKIIAERRCIPPNYLEQLLSQMTKAGIVKAVRGSKGGYQLAVAPEELTFLQVWETMEGGLEIATKDTRNNDAMQDLYREAEQAIKGVFSISLAELFARQQHDVEMTQDNLMFHI